MLPTEVALAAADLLAEIRAPAGQKSLPSARGVSENRVGLHTEDPRTVPLGPPVEAGEVLTEEHVPISFRLAQPGLERLERARPGCGCGHRAELVADAVTHEPKHTRRAGCPAVERQDRRRFSVRADDG